MFIRLIFFLTIVASIVTGCDTLNNQPSSNTDEENIGSDETSQTQVYECNDYEFSVYNDDSRANEITLYLPERDLTLVRVRAASGAKYQNNNILFWNKGDRALLKIEGNTYNCRRNP